MKLLKFLLAIFLIFSSSHGFCQKPFKVGVIYALSGPASNWGAQGRKTLELSLDQINSELLENNLKIELIFEDSQTNPKQAVTAFKKLVEIERVDLVIGDVWEYLTAPLIPLANKKNIPLLSPTIMETSITNQALNNSQDPASKYYFSFGSNTESLETPVDLALKLTQPKKAAIFCWNDNWGLRYKAMWEKMLKKNKIELVYSSCQSDYSYDYKSEAVKLVPLKPDLVIMSVSFELIAKQIVDSLPLTKFLTTSDAIEALYTRKVPNKLLEGLYFTDWPASKTFSDKFKSRWGAMPILEAENHYKVLKTIAEALKIKQKKDISLIEAFTKVKIKNTENNTDIDFSRGTFVNNTPGSLFIIRNGQIQLVEEE